MIETLALCFLLAIMLLGKLYPRETFIVMALVVVCIFAYPIIVNVQITGAAICSCAP